MKKIFLISILASAVIAIFSCGKQDCTQIEGRIIEKGSNKGVVNARVVFYQCVSGGFGQGSICEPFDTVFSDVNGKYSYMLEDDQTSNYHIEAYKDNYTMEDLQTAPGGRTTQNADIMMRPHAWIKFHVKNVNAFDDNDLIKAPGSYGGDDDYHFYGKNIDTSYVLGGNRYLGNKKAYINWSIKRNEITKYSSDSLFCKPLDTVFYEVKY